MSRFGIDRTAYGKENSRGERQRELKNLICPDFTKHFNVFKYSRIDTSYSDTHNGSLIEQYN